MSDLVMFLGWWQLVPTKLVEAVVEVGKKLVEAEILCWWRLGWWQLMPKKRVEAVEVGKKLVEAETGAGRGGKTTFCKVDCNIIFLFGDLVGGG